MQLRFLKMWQDQYVRLLLHDCGTIPPFFPHCFIYSFFFLLHFQVRSNELTLSSIQKSPSHRCIVLFYFKARELSYFIPACCMHYLAMFFLASSRKLIVH